MAGYRDLEAWREGMAMAVECYRLTEPFPKSEMYGLTSQIRRAATSVPANIAEGYGREGLGEYIQFLRIAQGSLKELETYLLLAEQIGFTTPEQAAEANRHCGSASRLLRGLLRKLQHTRDAASA